MPGLLRQLDHFDKKKLQGPVLILRLATISLLVVHLTIHVRSLRTFRWEQAVSGGVLVTYTVSMIGLALNTGIQYGQANAFQVYILSTGVVLLAINAAVIYWRWKRSGQLTRMLAELLGVVGVPLRRQVYTKVLLGAATAVLLMVDLFLTLAFLFE
ncbi:hypothetical protein evm_012650 [Chilo suppressalis]|nr:hypothetical protein evm_012650 [Chilo suppressalis]